jgi:hypothetical protein
VTVSGSGIPSGNTTLQLTPNFAGTDQSPIVASGSVSGDKTTWTGNVNLAGAAAGSYQLQLLNSPDVGTLTAKSFTVDPAGAPTITTVTPSTIGQGADATVTITGTNFAHGATVTFSKSTFTTTGPVVFDSTTQLHVPVHVASNAATGLANATNLTVTNVGPTPNSVTKTAAISASAGPSISSFSPKSLGQGAATTLTINGANFVSGATVVFGAGVTATGNPTVTSTTVKVPVKVASNAPASVSVKVQNPDSGSATATLPIDPFTFTSASPRYVANTFSGNLVLTGTGFATGATVSFPAGSGVSVQGGKSATVTNSGATLTVPIVVSRTTAISLDVTVTNSASNFGTATCIGCVGVAVAPAPPTNVVATKSGTSATVTWSPVPTASNGGAPITGYTITVTSPANSGVPPQTVAASTTSATFNGLATDSDYVFAIVSTNQALLSSAPVSATTSRQSHLSIAASRRRVVAGQSVQVHGALVNVTGLPIVSATVTVTRRSDSGVTGVVGTVTTDAAGRWSVLTRPTHNQTYQASYGGDADNTASSSGTARVVVAPRITTYADPESPSGRPLVVHGRVSPNKAGETVRLVAIDSAGRLHRLGALFLSPDSTYRFRVPLSAGRWRLQVRIGRTGNNVAGHSTYLRVTRD